MARAQGAAFEMQRLHGMGEGVYREVMSALPELHAARLRAGRRTPRPARLPRAPPARERRQLVVRAPAGRRRACRSTSCSRRRCSACRARAQPLPRDLYGPARINPHGVDLAVHRPARAAARRASARWRCRRCAKPTPPRSMPRCSACARRSPPGTRGRSHERAHILERAAERLEARLPQFCALLVAEGRKTWGDCVSEVREAIDFCRYYALRGRTRLAPMVLPGPTGERNELRLHGRGVFVCISPVELPARDLRRPGGRGAGGRQRGRRQAGRTNTRRGAGVRRAAARGRRAAPTRWHCCTAPARRSARRWWPHRALRRRLLHRLARRSPSTSSARWPRATDRSCR